ncbi:MAG TPA: hypothetical protein VLD65_05430 [Anaerolineales bacterium]|nr:hypothetical protein [Anaerolineales bacterium]
MKLQIPSDEKLADFSIQATASGIGEAARTLDDQAMLVFKYSDQSEVEAETQNREVMERYSSVELADEATEALKLEREGRVRKPSTG